MLIDYVRKAGDDARTQEAMKEVRDNSQNCAKCHEMAHVRSTGSIYSQCFRVSREETALMIRSGVRRCEQHRRTPDHSLCEVLLYAEGEDAVIYAEAANAAAVLANEVAEGLDSVNLQPVLTRYVCSRCAGPSSAD